MGGAEAVMGGAEAVQEGVMNPIFDRVVGTAPGIPVRPFFGGESGRPPAQPTRPSTPTKPGSVADVANNFQTPASIGFTMPPPTQATSTPTGLPADVEAQFQALMAQQQLVNDAPSGAGPVSTQGARSLPYYPDPGLAGHTPPQATPTPIHVQAEAVTPERFRPQPRRTAREQAMHGRLTEPSIMERPGVKKFLGKEEDDELGGMLKMMFMSDLIRGTAADTPSYPRAVSVGPASRDFAPLPSWRWR